MTGRSVPEWVADHPDQAIPKVVKARVFARYGGRCYLTDVRLLPGDYGEAPLDGFYMGQARPNRGRRYWWRQHLGVMAEAAGLLSTQTQPLGDGVREETKAGDEGVGEVGEFIAKAVCDALGFDPTNHHNALKCPYCNPKGLKLADDAPPLGAAVEVLRFIAVEKLDNGRPTNAAIIAQEALANLEPR